MGVSTRAPSVVIGHDVTGVGSTKPSSRFDHPWAILASSWDHLGTILGPRPGGDATAPFPAAAVAARSGIVRAPLDTGKYRLIFQKTDDRVVDRL
jgi:hypothetical protein